MRLYVLRHGQAEFRAPGSYDDCDRRLTDRGRGEVAAMLEQNSAAIEGVDLILASPYVRTQQTAEYVCDNYTGAAFETWPELVPEADILLLAERLQSLSAQRVLLVSHQPLVGMLISWLCGHESGRYPMDTASLAALQVEHLAGGLSECLWLRHATGLAR